MDDETFDANPELVERLRTMRWPEASTEARQRVWAGVILELEAMLRARGATIPPPSREMERAGHERLRERDLRRHDFAKPGAENRYSGALGARVAALRGASRPQFA
ncbi:MAG TPA: hypothetical protein VNB64_07510 [Solirubrobacteraceae bacterium]|nr:hypothetical protein [Solirubrobacteraceae bacterium]